LPLVAKFPRIHALRLLRGQPYQGVPPRFYQVFELCFLTQEDLEVAMASAERQVAREDLKNFRPLFRGEIHHVNYEIREIPIPGRPPSSYRGGISPEGARDRHADRNSAAVRRTH
jgi:hypothetical protein